VNDKITDQPALLEADRFTPPTRTPWGGHRIRRLKGLDAGPVVGESWEFSIEPSFPSELVSGLRLDELFPETPLLVKLLDAQQALSVQIHPSDDDPGLAPDEAGKPEAWYIVSHEPGAGIYLGLAPHATPEGMRAAIEQGDDVSELLTFVPVRAGDFICIDAGTPHCIGAGVFLVEPQRVSPGRRGVTYRYWDWNRTYDAQGKRDPAGEPRALHREQALRVTRWDLPRGEALLDEVRVRAGVPDVSAAPTCMPLGAPPLSVSRLSGTGELPLAAPDTPSALTVLEGQIELAGISVGPGRTAALPPGWRGTTQLAGAHAILSSA